MTGDEHVVQNYVEISYGPYRYSDTVRLLFKKQQLPKQKPESLTSKGLMKSAHKVIVQEQTLKKRSFNSKCKQPRVTRINKGVKLSKTLLKRRRNII